MASSLTFDKASARHTDQNGFMHVSETPISKAIVNPYRGSEIPNAEQLGLDPNKVYYLLRAPKELQRAASTFNNLPILDKHIPVSALDLNDPDLKKHVVGSTGTDAEFKEPYLVNSMVLHTASAIKDVEAGSKAELSCAYRYKPVMTPGTYEGKHYDGVMTELEGNHVAIVNEGRAGHDVKVMDSKLKERPVDYTKLAHAFGYDHAQERLRAALPALDAKGITARDDDDDETNGTVREIAEKDAEAAGKLAMLQPSKRNRELAAKAYQEAAREHRKAGFPKQARYHDNMAKEFTKPVGEDKAIAKRKDISPKQGITEYGSVKFADTKNHKYPIDTLAHVRAAASYFGKAKNRNEYSQEDQKIIDKRISAAKKKFKIGAEATESK